MSEQMSHQGFKITRTFDAPREDVFRAWIEPEQIVKWWGPHGLTTPFESVEVDPRVGGVLRLTMVVDASGDRYPVVAVFAELDEPERIVFDWYESDPETETSGQRTVVTFVDKDGKTELTFDHRGGEAENNARLEIGWGEMFERLAAAV